MLAYNVNDYTVMIDLEPGIYTLGSKGSSGKTMLAKLLAAISLEDSTVTAVNSKGDEHLISGTESVLMIDRFDFLKNDELVCLVERHRGIVLLDKKHNCNIQKKIRRAKLVFTKDRIEVTELCM